MSDFVVVDFADLVEPSISGSEVGIQTFEVKLPCEHLIFSLGTFGVLFGSNKRSVVHRGTRVRVILCSPGLVVVEAPDLIGLRVVVQFAREDVILCETFVASFRHFHFEPDLAAVPVKATLEESALVELVVLWVVLEVARAEAAALGFVEEQRYTIWNHGVKHGARGELWNVPRHRLRHAMLVLWVPGDASSVHVVDPVDNGSRLCAHRRRGTRWQTSADLVIKGQRVAAYDVFVEVGANGIIRTEFCAGHVWNPVLKGRIPSKVWNATNEVADSLCLSARRAGLTWVVA